MPDNESPQDVPVAEAAQHHFAAFDPSSIDPPQEEVDALEAPSDEVAADPVEAGAELPDFDPRYKDEFDGLMFIGALSSKFRWFHHDFEIRTLRTDELLRVSLAIKPYQQSLGDAKAYQAAVVAACVVSVDGQPLPLPIDSTDPDAVFRYRYDWVTRKWFPPILDVVYEEYLTLEAKVAAALAAAGN